MGITGRPASGARFELERVEGAGAGAGEEGYAGHVHLPGGSYALEVLVALPGGSVTARLDPSAPRSADLERAAAALVRSAVKGALSAGRPLPRKIVRWRG